jgi:hypothetical protein
MAEPTIETLLDVMHNELARLREKAIAINLVSADLLRRGYYVYRQEMPDELYHLLAIRDDDAAIYRIRVLTHPPVRGMDDLLPGELVATVIDGAIAYRPSLPEANARQSAVVVSQPLSEQNATLQREKSGSI